MRDKYVYPYSAAEAKQLGELDDWRASHKLNKECAEAIDRAVREGFDGMHLPGDIAENACCEFGLERVRWVLANTVQHADWDGRYRPQNKKWAESVNIPRNNQNGHTTEFVLKSHPELVNGLVNQYRRYYDSLGLFDRSHCESEAEGEIDYTGKIVVLDPNILKDEYKTPKDQLFFAESGFGCSPNSRGRKVFGHFLKGDEQAYYRRHEILGVLKNEHLPDWAREKLNTQTADPAEEQVGGITLQ